MLDMGTNPNLDGIRRAFPMWAPIPDDQCDSYGLEVLDELVNAGGNIGVRNEASGTLLHSFTRVRECDDALARAFVDSPTSLGLDPSRPRMTTGARRSTAPLGNSGRLRLN